jgi:hypothetical protein
MAGCVVSLWLWVGVHTTVRAFFHRPEDFLLGHVFLADSIWASSVLAGSSDKSPAHENRAPVSIADTPLSFGSRPKHFQKDPGLHPGGASLALSPRLFLPPADAALRAGILRRPRPIRSISRSAPSTNQVPAL